MTNDTQSNPRVRRSVRSDGAVTPKDASYIQKYINFADILEEPKTWAEIIKK